MWNTCLHMCTFSMERLSLSIPCPLGRCWEVPGLLHVCCPTALHAHTGAKPKLPGSLARAAREIMWVSRKPQANVAIQLSKLGLRPSNSLALCPKVMLRQHLCFYFDDIFYAYYSTETLCSWRTEYGKRTKAVPKTHMVLHSLSKLCKFSIYSLKIVITTF